VELLSRFDLVHLNPGESSDLLMLAYLIELLALINKVFSQKKCLNGSQITSKKLIPVLDYIDNNIISGLSLQSIADRFFINKYYLSTLFKNNTGLSIHEYIVLKRISKAKTLLLENLSISEVCQRSGFCDYSHFIRAFKQNVGVSPGHYKKQHALLKKRGSLSDMI
jgi:YesN/AraC family two-component response regulator